MRDALQMDGLWRFLPDPRAEGEFLGFWKKGYDARLWSEVAVPSCFDTGHPHLAFYEGVCWYRLAFRVPQDWSDRRIVLRFEGVNYRAKAWLNSEFLGENQDGFLPFEFEIQSTALWDGDNILVLVVDNAHHEGDVPGMHVGWRGYGGILREVRLYATDLLRIEELRVVATPGAQAGDMAFRLRIRNSRRDAVTGTIALTVFDGNGKACAEPGSEPIPLAADAAADVVLKGTLANARAWSPSSPALYRARVRLKVRGQVIDETEQRFGFRRIEATPDGLLLNGKPIFLTGFNRHEDSPRAAMAADLETTRRDLVAMKEAGANFVRLCHYPHHPAELDLCDEIGLLVFAELPLYFWNDIEEGRRTNAARVRTAARQLERMVARDFNHPGIVFWSVSNETADGEPEVAKSNRELIRAARALDPTRLCVHVSCCFHTDPNFDEDDVICVNWYPSGGKHPRGLAPSAIDLSLSTGKWRTALTALRRQYPAKPILVTEFGYNAFPGAHGHTFGEDMYARVLEAEFAAMDATLVCGATIWCWAGHPWPAARFWGGLVISPFGVLSRDRRKLKQYWTARALFRARQAIGPVQASPDPGSTAVLMIRPHLNDIPSASFPDGYGIRPMTMDDIGLWTDIQRDAEPYLQITDRTFRNEFCDNLEALRWRCYIVIDPRGLGVGTISAWYDRDFRGQDYGRIHWVAVRPSCQGKGLGKAALSYALNNLAQWHDRCYLATSTERVPAIRLYLKYGFEPDLRPADARTLWSDLNTRLKNPVLERSLGNQTEEKHL